MSDYTASGSWDDPIVLLFSSDEEDSVDDDKENEKLCYTLANIKTDPALLVANKEDGPKTKEEESASGTIAGLLCDEIHWAPKETLATPKGQKTVHSITPEEKNPSRTTMQGRLENKKRKNRSTTFVNEESNKSMVLLSLQKDQNCGN
jgi:hypothetical protein